jgi:hypothetical protein
VILCPGSTVIFSGSCGLEVKTPACAQVGIFLRPSEVFLVRSERRTGRAQLETRDGPRPRHGLAGSLGDRAKVAELARIRSAGRARRAWKGQQGTPIRRCVHLVVAGARDAAFPGRARPLEDRRLAHSHRVYES